MVGSVDIVEHAYQLGNATRKQELLMELFSTELQLFKDLISVEECRLVDIISKLSLQKSSVLRHMSCVIQPIPEKGIVDHSILHRLLIEYFTIADKERKKIVEGMKSHVGKIAYDQHGSMVLACILSTVDDTKLLKKIVISELQKVLKELVFKKLLHQNCSCYFSPNDLASLNLSIPSLSFKGEVEMSSDLKVLKKEESGEKEDNGSTEVTTAEGNKSTNPEELQLVEGGKKDPNLRRQELLVDTGLAENLIDVCIEDVGELRRSNFGKEVLYEFATGGSGGILQPMLDKKLNSLHEAIATLSAESKSGEQTDHILENFHSSRTLRKLVLDSPAFATTLWKKALKEKCGLWAQGHSSKIICAFLE